MGLNTLPIPPGDDQDAVLAAVGDEIARQGFVIAQADKRAKAA